MPATKQSKYQVTVKMNDETYQGKTDDVTETLLDLAPKVFKTKVVIKIANNDSSIERVFMIPKAKMLFRNRLAMAIFVRNTILALRNN